MSILDTNYYKKLRMKYLYFSIFCLVFGIIYEIFSFGVYSLYMILAFTIPFIGAIGTYLLENNKDKIVISLYHISIITLTIGSIIKGVLDIYGTTNTLIYIYLIVGIISLILSIIKKIIN